MKEKIASKLKAELNYSHLEIINESHLHAGHNGFDGTGESHFKINITAEKLNSLSKVKAHQLIYGILKEELKTIHALSINIKASLRAANQVDDSNS